MSDILSHDELEMVLSGVTCAGIGADDDSHGARLRRHILAREAEHRALVADNAALFVTLRNIYRREDTNYDAPTAQALSSPHPGAALLSEMEALRKRVEASEAAHLLLDRAGQSPVQPNLGLRVQALLEKCDEGWRRAKAAETERDEARAQVATARAAAIEDAANEAFAWTQNAKLASRIRALATTPPPPVVPVAKVREVLRELHDTNSSGNADFDGGWTSALKAVSEDLGTDFDGEP